MDPAVAVNDSITTSDSSSMLQEGRLNPLFVPDGDLTMDERPSSPRGSESLNRFSPSASQARPLMGGSPCQPSSAKYVSPRLRRSPIWSFSYGGSRWGGGGGAPGSSSATVIPVHLDSGLDELPSVATPAFRKLFRTVCHATPQQNVFEGAKVRRAKVSAAALFPAFQDYATRGVILSFSNRAPSFDLFQAWISTNMAQAGITIDDASQLGNDFFLLLLHDQANQQLALKEKLFFHSKFVDSFPWTPEFSPHALAHQTKPIWVELTNLHSSLRLRATVEEVIQDNLGPILHFPETGTLVHHNNPRILIRWRMTEEPADFLALEDHGDTLLQKVTFLNHPDVCHRCKRTDHLLRDCNFPPHFRKEVQHRLSPSRHRPVAASHQTHLRQEDGPQIANGVQFEEHGNSQSDLNIPILQTGLVPPAEVSVAVDEQLGAPLGDQNIAMEPPADVPPLPVHLRIRTSSLSKGGPVEGLPVELVSPTVSIPDVPGELMIDLTCHSPLAPAEIEHLPRWADYSSASDTEVQRHSQLLDPEHGKSKDTTGRKVLSPPMHNHNSQRQRDRSPNSHRRSQPRFNPKAAARQGFSSHRHSHRVSQVNSSSFNLIPGGQ
ncbi:unnamed protein product [Calypogeia fissa]